MRSRDFRHSLTLQQNVRRSDPVSGQRLNTWETVGGRFNAHIATAPGREQSTADAKTDVVITHTITLLDSSRSRAITAAMRFVDRAGIIYAIESKPRPKQSGRAKHVVLDCTEMTTPQT